MKEALGDLTKEGGDLKSTELLGTSNENQESLKELPYKVGDSVTVSKGPLSKVIATYPGTIRSITPAPWDKARRVVEVEYQTSISRLSKRKFEWWPNKSGSSRTYAHSIQSHYWIGDR